MCVSGATLFLCVEIVINEGLHRASIPQNLSADDIFCRQLGVAALGRNVCWKSHDQLVWGKFFLSVRDVGGVFREQSCNRKPLAATSNMYS
jgi:hypothetical protein